MLVAAGADPTIPSIVQAERELPNGRTQADGEAAIGDPAVSALQVASGAGYDGNYHRESPGGRFRASHVDAGR